MNNVTNGDSSSTSAASDAHAHQLFATGSRVPIASLSPSSVASTYIRAVVSLVWPFSSSTRTFALLLAEEDFRLRRAKGQVKVTFRGKAAADVAATKIGIGDVVLVGVEDADWILKNGETQPEGQALRDENAAGLEWDLVVKKRVALQVGCTVVEELEQ